MYRFDSFTLKSKRLADVKEPFESNQYIPEIDQKYTIFPTFPQPDGIPNPANLLNLPVVKITIQLQHPE